MLDRISDGRTDLVFDYLSEGNAAGSTDGNGVSLIKWCAYYGDVSAVRFLLASGESLDSLGENFDLNGAAFTGGDEVLGELLQAWRTNNRINFFLIDRISEAGMKCSLSKRGGRDWGGNHAGAIVFRLFSTRAAWALLRQMISIVLSPAIVPITSGQSTSSIPCATPFALPGGV